jgi:DNA repair protein RadC
MTKSEDAAGVHSGHRQRLKDQFLTHGMDPIHDVNVLELVLFYAIPRQDTNPIAHRLLNTFGSLAAVFDATPEELMERGGLSKNAATLIKLIPAAARRQQLSRSSCHQLLDSTQKCGDYLVPFFFGATQEEVYLLGLDAKCKVLGCVKLSTGSVNSAGLSIRKVVECALNMKASSVVLAHNHTSGIAVPSQEDIRTTQSISHALDLVGVYLADHVVVADEDYVSMAESGLI